ncbi:MAG: MurR/RpiR family transcriptional regulator [Bacillota bacterium]|nr:MurR/RpiR family transcriptional regulator [Bacillota bacterium]
MTSSILDSVDISTLTDNEKILYEYLKSNLKNIIYLSLQDICDELYISNATIVRFCQKIGYKGFNEFKFQIRQDLYSKNQHTSLIPKRNSILKDFVLSLDEEFIMKCIEMIQSDQPIYIYGRNMASLPARYLFSMLRAMRYQCICIDWLDFLQSLSEKFPKNAVLFAFTNYGRKDTYEKIIKNCKQRNVHIVWISSEDIDEELQNATDLYLCTHEERLDDVNLRTHMNSFVFIQILIDTLKQKS